MADLIIDERVTNVPSRTIDLIVRTNNNSIKNKETKEKILPLDSTFDLLERDKRDIDERSIEIYASFRSYVIARSIESTSLRPFII